MLFKKEKEVIELILKHLDAVEESLISGIQTIEFYLEDNISGPKGVLFTRASGHGLERQLITALQMSTSHCSSLSLRPGSRTCICP